MVAVQFNETYFPSAGLYYSSSSCSSSENEYEDVNPTQLLSLAIRKRRAVYNRKERDFRQELLHTGLIQSLCKYLGEIRVKKRRHRRSKNSRNRSVANRKRLWSDKPIDAECKAMEMPTFDSEKLVDFDGETAVSNGDSKFSHADACCESFQPPEKKACRCDDGDPFLLEPIFKEMFGSHYIQESCCCGA